MRDDLISRKTIKSQIQTIRDCWKISPYVSPSDMKLYALAFDVVLQTISDCRTAFDKENVEKKINNLREHAENRKKECYVETSGCHYYSGMLETLDVVEQIIKKGGIA